MSEFKIYWKRKEVDGIEYVNASDETSAKKIFKDILSNRFFDNATKIISVSKTNKNIQENQTLSLVNILNEDDRGVVHNDTYNGLILSVEFPYGHIRSGTSPEGEPWSNTYDSCSYGFIDGVPGYDGDSLDFYLSINPIPNALVYIIHQLDIPEQVYEQSKIMFGFSSDQAAIDAWFKYTLNPENRFAGITTITFNTFQQTIPFCCENTIICSENLLNKFKRGNLIHLDTKSAESNENDDMSRLMQLSGLE